MQFLNEAAQMEDTSLQVSGMKIREDVKKLSQKWERRKPSESQEKHPCEYCGQMGTHPAGKNWHVAKSAQIESDLTTSQQCVELGVETRITRQSQCNQRIKNGRNI